MIFLIKNLNNYSLETLRNMILISMERETQIFLCYFRLKLYCTLTSLLGDDITEKWLQTKTEEHFVCWIFTYPRFSLPSLISQHTTGRFWDRVSNCGLVPTWSTKFSMENPASVSGTLTLKRGDASVSESQPGKLNTELMCVM